MDNVRPYGKIEPKGLPVNRGGWKSAAGLTGLALLAAAGGCGRREAEMPRPAAAAVPAPGAAAVAPAVPGASQPPPPAARPPPALAAPPPAAAPTLVQRMRDPAVPLQERLAELDRLARTGDAQAVQALMAVGEAQIYLSAAAVERLGRIRDPGVTAYLRGKLADADHVLVLAAVRGLLAQGTAAIAPLREALERNRQREDGYQDVILTECVRALAAIGSRAAVPILTAELARVGAESERYEYGAEIARALRSLGDPAAAPALLDYADRLERRRQAMADNPMGQWYLQDHIGLAREVAAALRGTDG